MLCSCRVFPYCLIFQHLACGSDNYLIKSFFFPCFFFTVDEEREVPECKETRSLQNHPALWFSSGLLSSLSLFCFFFCLKKKIGNCSLPFPRRGNNTPLPDRTEGSTAPKGLLFNQETYDA